MTEEQRYRERIQLEKDKVQLLKRIAEALDIIAASYAQQKYKMDMSAVEKVYKKEKFDRNDIVDPFKFPD